MQTDSVERIRRDGEKLIATARAIGDRDAESRMIRRMRRKVAEAEGRDPCSIEEWRRPDPVRITSLRLVQQPVDFDAAGNLDREPNIGTEAEPGHAARMPAGLFWLIFLASVGGSAALVITFISWAIGGVS